MAKFEIGKQYSVRSIGDHNLIWEYTVVARTPKTVKLMDEFGRVTTCRICQKTSEFFHTEAVYPQGHFSMCPILRA